MKTISLLRLASTCIDAGRQGCEVIRSFHQVHQNAIDGQLKIGGDPRSVVTACDVDTQAKIIMGLRKTWGDEITIIGEEDEAESPFEQNHGEHNPLLLRKDILFDNQEVSTVIPQDLDEEIPLDELVIFVDPVDGTREFVEGRLRNVACLIGIARGSRPIAGIISVPFPAGDVATPAATYYAVADQIKLNGVWPKKLGSNDDESSAVESEAVDFTILTGDSSNPVLQKATNCAANLIANGNVRHSIVGGTASKLRLVATSKSPTIAILHFDTELWDTCAAEALLNVKGGKVTDLFGAPLVHCPKRKFGNIFGVVASLGGSDVHDELCRRMRADREVVQKIFEEWIGTNLHTSEAQAIDIARDLDGIPYRLENLQQLLRKENPLNLSLKGYSVPESSAWRGLMSNGVRYSLDWSAKDNENPSCLPPNDIFYKRIEMAHLTHAQDKLKTAPHKVCRL